MGECEQIIKVHGIGLLATVLIVDEYLRHGRHLLVNVALHEFAVLAVFSSQDMLFVQAAGTKAYYLEGAAGFLRVPWLIYVQRFLMHFSMINLGLAVFNLLPIPPLDGYHVLNDVFLRGKLHLSPKVLQGMTVGLLILFYATRFLSEWIGKAVNAIQGGAVAGILAIFGLG